MVIFIDRVCVFFPTCLNTVLENFFQITKFLNSLKEYQVSNKMVWENVILSFEQLKDS